LSVNKIAYCYFYHILTTLFKLFFRSREDFICLMKEAMHTSPDPLQITNPWVLINCDGEEV